MTISRLPSLKRERESLLAVLKNERTAALDKMFSAIITVAESFIESKKNNFFKGPNYNSANDLLNTAKNLRDIWVIRTYNDAALMINSLIQLVVTHREQAIKNSSAHFAPQLDQLLNDIRSINSNFHEKAVKIIKEFHKLSKAILMQNRISEIDVIKENLAAYTNPQPINVAMDKLKKIFSDHKVDINENDNNLNSTDEFIDSLFKVYKNVREKQANPLLEIAIAKVLANMINLQPVRVTINKGSINEEYRLTYHTRVESLKDYFVEAATANYPIDFIMEKRAWLKNRLAQLTPAANEFKPDLNTHQAALSDSDDEEKFYAAATPPQVSDALLSAVISDNATEISVADKDEQKVAAVDIIDAVVETTPETSNTATTTMSSSEVNANLVSNTGESDNAAETKVETNNASATPLTPRTKYLSTLVKSSIFTVGKTQDNLRPVSAKSKAANPAADQAATVEETSASTVSDRVKLFENRKP